MGQIEIAKITNVDLSIERAFFKRCWYSIYHSCSLQQLGFSNLSKTLQDSFDQEEQDYVAHAPHRLFFHALRDGNIVGYISFEIQNDQVVDIKQIAFSPKDCTIDTLRELIFIIFEYVDEVSCIHMTLHRQAHLYNQISKDIGFVAQSGSDRALWIQSKMQFNKCGTCLCDFDYDDEQTSAQDGENGVESEDFLIFPPGEEEENWGCSQGDHSGFCSYSDKD